MNEVIGYTLSMFGILIDGETNCFCDKKSVITKAIVPLSSLHKKHNIANGQLQFEGTNLILCYVTGCMG